MNMEKASAVLAQAGIPAERKNVLKNGKKLEALSVGTGRIRPTIYQANLDMFDTDDELIEFCNRTIEQSPNLDPEEFCSRDYILAHVISCIRHATDDNETVKFPVFGDLEEYFRVPIGSNSIGSMSMVLTQHVIDRINLNSDELRIVARRNLAKTVSIRSMSEVLTDMIGEDSLGLPIPGEDFMYVATANGGIKGAGIMLLDDALNNFCQSQNVNRIIIIPSSTEEVLLIPDRDKDADAMNRMVQEVNAAEVSEDMQLSDHIYYYDRSSDL